MTTLIFPILIFVFGTLIGSFLNVVILRYFSGQDITTSRSACPKCGNTLRWWELVPILSFTFLRGRCARCASEISVQYPLVELATGLLFLTLATPLSSTPVGIISTLLLFTITSLVIILFVIDLKAMILPDIFIILFTVTIFFYIMFSPSKSLTACYLLLTTCRQPFNSMYGMFIGTGFLVLLYLVTRGRGIGFGDVKLMLPLGLLFGLWGTISLLLISFWAGGLVGLWLLLAKKATVKTAIPFGPFLLGAAVLLLLFPSLPLHLLTLLGFR
ncbi:MAG: prepilin peptidase [bacterium]|nr:prepilin peptidase [bacterium]MDZ4346529.1 prepilin peptidase [Candidatus Binatia bacterium]